MKKITSIRAGLIAAVLLFGVSTSAMAWNKTYSEDRVGNAAAHYAHWAPYNGPIEYFFMCTIGQRCEGSKWR